MKKLTRENIYINLQGKSEAELTELYWLLKNNNQKLTRPNLEDFLGYKNHSIYYVLICDGIDWSADDCFDKIEVTIQQLKEILQPMEDKEEQLIKEAKERGFLTEGNEFYSCFDDKNELRIINPYDSESEIKLYLDSNGYLRYYDGLNNEYNESLCSNPAIYKDGVWAEFKETLEQQLEKAKAEVKRLKKEINKIKDGDWVFVNETDTIFKVKERNFTYRDHRPCKITDQELINKLNELIK